MLQTRIEELKQYAFVIKQLSLKEHKRKTDETNLGVVWNVLNPLLYMVVLSTYYQNVIMHDVENFPVYVFSGIIVYSFYNAGIRGAMYSMVANKDFLIKGTIPCEIYLLNRVLIAFKELVFSSVALIPILWFFHISVTWTVLQIVPVLCATTIMIIGIGEILAIVYAYFADIDYLYSIVMTMMFFVSGTFLPIERMPRRLAIILEINPIYLSINLFRNALLFNIQSSGIEWLKLGMWVVGFRILGYIIFANNKNKLIEKI